IPKPLVIMVKVARQPCQALLDTGSMGDFVLTTLADQLKLKLTELRKPLVLQLTISGSRGKVKHLAEVVFEYQDIQDKCTFHVANLDSHDVILGLPFLIQHSHSVLVGFNPAQVMIRSEESLPLTHDQEWALSSSTVNFGEGRIEILWKELTEYAHDICKEAIETPLPPLCIINHVIPLIDEPKVYSWHPLKCPEALKPLWRAKWDDYIRTGQWEFHSGTNSIPMIML
ncbi:hypothetical protein P691DRAFT_623237, partial [Macrolepiota fuliginosa MF-IS2]